MSSAKTAVTARPKTVAITARAYEELKRLREVLLAGGEAVLPENLRPVAVRLNRREPFTNGALLWLALRLLEERVTGAEVDRPTHDLLAEDLDGGEPPAGA